MRSSIPRESFGDWRVVTERQGLETSWYVEHARADTQLYLGEDRELAARTFAATLDAAGLEADDLPPSLHPNPYVSGKPGPWEDWAERTHVIPAAIATTSNASIAGWLAVVHQLSQQQIADELGVGEQTVRQYLADLRNGRR